ncbi:MAG: hypothetical protein H6819_05750 [Phycisphaerales bacterium]|nr:hypothetical protein [Phycisphaerales bacterium]MCB9858676.1 hypothetical protein [Phycisphaerales bacterium]MCB9864468.1 hypothetical protein [Phycisphaerales bacterium]
MTSRYTIIATVCLASILGKQAQQLFAQTSSISWERRWKGLGRFEVTPDKSEIIDDFGDRWSVATGGRLGAIEFPEFDAASFFRNYQISPNGSEIAVQRSGSTEAIDFFSLSNGQLTYSLPLSATQTGAFAYSADGARLCIPYATSTQSFHLLFNRSTQSNIFTLAQTIGYPTFSVDSSEYATFDFSAQHVVRRNTSNGAVLASIPLPAFSPSTVEYSDLVYLQNGDIVAVGIDYYDDGNGIVSQAPFCVYVHVASVSMWTWVNGWPDCCGQRARISVSPDNSRALLSTPSIHGPITPTLVQFSTESVSQSQLPIGLTEWITDSTVVNEYGVYSLSGAAQVHFPTSESILDMNDDLLIVRENPSPGKPVSEYLVNTNSGSVMSTLSATDFSRAAVNRVGTLYASPRNNGNIDIRRVTDNGLERTLIGPIAANVLTFAGDTNMLLSGGSDSQVRLWNTENGDQFVLPSLHGSTIIAIDTTRDGQRAVSASTNGNVVVWDISDVQNIHAVQSFNVPSVDEAIIAPDGTSVLTEDTAAGLSRWDVATGTPIYTILAGTDINWIATNKAGELFLTEEGSRLSIRRMADGEVVAEILDSIGGNGSQAFFIEGGEIIRRTERAMYRQSFPHLFVDSLASFGGNGESWATAFGSIDAALDYLNSDDKVANLWVAAGTYMPTMLTDPMEPRSATYSIPDGVRIYGGFAGTESLLSERDPIANPTFLTQSALNSRTLLSPVGSATLDGVTIQRTAQPPAATEDFRLSGTGSLTFRNCKIMTDGDGYISLDPDPANPAIITLENTPIEIVIQPDTFCGKAGELLELRSPDVLCGTSFNPDCESGLIDAAGAAVFSGTPAVRWIIDRLEVKSGTTLNLTNRPNFDFREMGDLNPECLYVRDLIIESGARINTGLQTVYYETLTQGGATSNVPLFGFSLINVDMECQEEFDARIDKRIRDENDMQPANPPFLEGAINRSSGQITGDPMRFYMEMKTEDTANGSNSASTVSAKASFARAMEDQILVAFEYLFCGSATDEMVVYLSDSPEAGENLVEIARISPPASGPGSIGSGAFATFSGLFPRGSLNFRRGTYVELELIGEEACVLIDEWDPLVCNNPECGDCSGDYVTTKVDLLYAMTALGNVVINAGARKTNCLDRANLDNYVDINDVLLSDALYGYGVTGLCDGGGSSDFAGMTNGVTTQANLLVVAAKSNVVGDQSDRLYPVNSSTAVSDPSIAPPVAAGDSYYGPRGHGRLIKDGAGNLYQLHSVLGLIRLSDGQVMVAPGEQEFMPPNGDTVRLGMPSTGSGLPMFDAAFDPNDATIVYVVPARIIPFGGTESDAYYTAAKLQLAENAGTVTWTVEQTYGYDPQTDPNNNTQPPQYSQTNVQYLREIESDASGNLFVTCARADNQNDWLLIYNSNGGTASEQRIRLSDLATPVRGPAALHVTDDGTKLYLGTSLDEGDPMTTTVQEFALGGTTGAITVTPSRVIEVGDMRFATSIAEDDNGTVHIIGYTAPVQDPFSIQFNEDDSLFTTATLATLPLSGTTVVALPITGADAALPISAVFVSGSSGCLVGDVDGSGTIDISDVPDFVDVLLNGPDNPDQACRADANQDGNLDGRDVGGFVDAVIAG